MAITLQGGSTTIQSNMVIMSSIVEDGLTLFMDPNDINSYSGTGTAVTNIAPTASSNSITGTLDAASMYVNPSDSAAYFRVRSDSVIQRLDFSGTITRNADEASTVMFYFWSSYVANGQYGNSQAFFGGKYTNYMAIRGGSDGTYGTEAETNGAGTPEGNHDYFANQSGVFNTSTWNSWTSVFNSNQATNYYNGAQHPTQYNFIAPASSAQTFNRLGSNSTGTGSGNRGGDIRMGALLIYNRALSGEEIRQNLDILDRRFS